MYAYSQQANFAIERDLGGGFALSLAYNFNGGRHLNRPINSNPARGDYLVTNWHAPRAIRTSSASCPPVPTSSTAPRLSASGWLCGPACADELLPARRIESFTRRAPGPGTAYAQLLAQRLSLALFRQRVR